jgi:hypothetical protein
MDRFQDKYIKELLVDGGQLKLIDYSEKAFVIFGETYVWMDDIKRELRYVTFNKYLKYNGYKIEGWLVPKSKNSKDFVVMFVKDINYGTMEEREEIDFLKPKAKRARLEINTQRVIYDIDLPRFEQKVQLKTKGLLVGEYTVYSLDNQGRFVDRITLIDEEDVFHQAAIVAGEWQILYHDVAHELVFV